MKQARSAPAFRLVAGFVAAAIAVSGCASTRSIAPPAAPASITDSLQSEDVGCQARIFLLDGREQEGVLTGFTGEEVRIQVFRHAEPIAIPVGEIERIEIKAYPAPVRAAWYALGLAVVFTVVLSAVTFDDLSVGL